ATRLGVEQVSHLEQRFYPRPCARGDQRRMFAVPFASLFLSTPLREGRPAYQTVIAHLNEFLSTPLREGRLAADQFEGRIIGFYPRPCARGDRWNSRNSAMFSVFLS